MREYFQLSKRGSFNFVLAGVLCLLYELMIRISAWGSTEGGMVINAVDGLMTRVLALVPNGSLAVAIFALLIGLYVFYQDRKEGIHPTSGILSLMWLESCIWAFVVFFNLSYALSHLPLHQSVVASAGSNTPSYIQNLALSLGAGFYEEFFFRLVLAALCSYSIAAIGLAATDSLANRLFTIGITAFLFAAAHLDAVLTLVGIGGMGEAFDFYAFVFRFAFGVVMSGLLQLRGFAITAWTHALYDVLVFTLRALS